VVRGGREEAKIFVSRNFREEDFSGLESYFKLLSRLTYGSTPLYQGSENLPG